MSTLLPFIIVGLTTGALYGLAGVGLVLTFRTSGVLNLGHGAVAAGAAYLFHTLHVTHGVAWPVAAVVTVLLYGAVVGVVLELVTRSLADAPQAVGVLATIGILLLGEGILYLIFGSVTRNAPQFLPTSGFRLAGVPVQWAQVVTFAVAAVTAAALYLFLRFNRLGIAMRAVVDNPVLMNLAGLPPTRVRRTAWCIGSAFAAMSGVLLAPTLGLDPNLLVFLVVQAFGACAVGLFKNLPMTFVGGLLVGVAASVATKYLTAPPWAAIPSAVPFLVLLVLLIIVPARRLPQQGASMGGLLPETAWPRRTVASLGTAAVLWFLVLPEVVGARLPLWTNAGVYVIVFGSLGLLVWTSGQISLCHAAFVAVGVTAMSHLSEAGVPWLPGVLLAGLITAPVGAIVAIPAIRQSGVYLALATLGFGIFMQNVVYGTNVMFGTELLARAGRPEFGFIDGQSDRTYYYIVLAAALAVCAFLTWVSRSRLGRLLNGMSESPTMLLTHGLALNLTRVTVFAVSAFLAGVAGALTLSQVGSAAGAGFSPLTSITFLAILAVFGSRLVPSAVLAACAYTVVPGYVSNFGINEQIFGFGALAVVSAVVLSRRGSLGEWMSMAERTTSFRRGTHPMRARGPRLRDLELADQA